MTQSRPEWLNPTDPAFIACPFPAYRRLRDEAPVVYVPHGRGFWFVTRHDLCQQAVADTATFSSKVKTLAFDEFPPDLLAKMTDLARQGVPNIATLLTTDPPLHTRNRRLVSRAFTPRAVKEHEPFVRALCRDLIAAIPDVGEFDFVRSFAIPVPVQTIAQALAVPAERAEDFKRWSDAAVALIGSKLPDDEVLDSIRGGNELGAFVIEQIADRRLHPGTDVLSTLVHARLADDETEDLDSDAPRQLSDEEIYSIVRQILVAGNETTTNLLTQMVVRFAREPQWWTAMRDDPSIIPAVVEEALRMFAPSGVNQRITTREVTLGGVTIPAGASVLLVYLSADHDERVFADPEHFDPTRANLADHLAFGRGIHFCVGAALARMEARVALEELSRATNGFELVDADHLEWNSSFSLRAIRRLPVRQRN
jgi:cytochrome P450